MREKRCIISHNIIPHLGVGWSRHKRPKKEVLLNSDPVNIANSLWSVNHFGELRNLVKIVRESKIILKCTLITCVTCPKYASANLVSDTKLLNIFIVHKQLSSHLSRRLFRHPATTDAVDRCPKSCVNVQSWVIFWKVWWCSYKCRIVGSSYNSPHFDSLVTCGYLQ